VAEYEIPEPEPKEIDEKLAIEPVVGSDSRRLI
jgi:hypothetical protein